MPCPPLATDKFDLPPVDQINLIPTPVGQENFVTAEFGIIPVCAHPGCKLTVFSPSFA